MKQGGRTDEHGELGVEGGGWAVCGVEHEADAEGGDVGDLGAVGAGEAGVASADGEDVGELGVVGAGEAGVAGGEGNRGSGGTF
jgi:hypothetical protein